MTVVDQLSAIDDITLSIWNPTDVLTRCSGPMNSFETGDIAQFHCVHLTFIGSILIGLSHAFTPLCFHKISFCIDSNELDFHQLPIYV